MVEETRDKKVEKSHAGFRHLKPLEIYAIQKALSGNLGAKVGDLAREYGVTRQTIHNVRKKVLVPSAGDEGEDPIPTKLTRQRRISSNLREKVISLKRKYPTWGAPYIRSRLLKEGWGAFSLSTTYNILREEGLAGRQIPPKSFTRFEMKRPGQLFQIDVQGKLWIPHIGWIYGHAVLDDYSRHCVAFRYFTEESMNNAILTLHEAIQRVGVPEAIYADNGAVFRSRGEKLNNFELYCAALHVEIVHSSVYYPQGKGKIERFYRTVQDQFIVTVLARVAEDPAYDLKLLNKDLQNFIQADYNVRRHGATKQSPADRFAERSLQPLPGDFRVTAFLERGKSRQVSKYGEVPFKGFKIQVDLPYRTEVNVVETLSTVRVESKGHIVREVEKAELQKEPRVNHQDGIDHTKHSPEAGTIRGRPPSVKKFGEGKDGSARRWVNPDGNFQYDNVTYHLGEEWAGQAIYVTDQGNDVAIYNVGKIFVKTIPQRPTIHKIFDPKDIPKSFEKSPVGHIYRRPVNDDGTIYFQGKVHLFDKKLAIKTVFLTRKGTWLLVWDENQKYLTYIPPKYRIRVNWEGKFIYRNRIYFFDITWCNSTILVYMGKNEIRVFQMDGTYLTSTPIADGYPTDGIPENFFGS